MFLVCAATCFELESFRAACAAKVPCMTAVTGVGPLETAVRLCRTLTSRRVMPSAVVNIGTAGAYYREDGAGMLDICLARQEIMGDLGVCRDNGDIEPVSGPGLEVMDRFALDHTLLSRARQILQTQNIEAMEGVFVTVNSVSGTRRRGEMLAAAHGAHCENMEGAAVARVCAEFGLPLLELRAISNMVDDRDRQSWQLKQAAAIAGRAAAFVLEGMCNTI